MRLIGQIQITMATAETVRREPGFWDKVKRGLGGKVNVPYGAFRRVLVTVEWSPVEPQLEKKYYRAGIGEIKEQVVQGGHEQFQLVNVTR